MGSHRNFMEGQSPYHRVALSMGCRTAGHILHHCGMRVALSDKGATLSQKFTSAQGLIAGTTHSAGYNVLKKSLTQGAEPGSQAWGSEETSLKPRAGQGIANPGPRRKILSDLDLDSGHTLKASDPRGEAIHAANEGDASEEVKLTNTPDSTIAPRAYPIQMGCISKKAETPPPLCSEEEKLKNQPFLSAGLVSC